MLISPCITAIIASINIIETVQPSSVELDFFKHQLWFIMDGTGKGPITHREWLSLFFGWISDSRISIIHNIKMQVPVSQIVSFSLFCSCHMQIPNNLVVLNLVVFSFSTNKLLSCVSELNKHPMTTTVVRPRGLQDLLGMVMLFFCKIDWSVVPVVSYLLISKLLRSKFGLHHKLPWQCKKWSTFIHLS